jgi:hypothetical protein
MCFGVLRWVGEFVGWVLVVVFWEWNWWVGFWWFNFGGSILVLVLLIQFCA